EVEVIGEEGGSIRVRTPDGIEGWVPRVVIVGSPARERAPSASQPEPPVARRRWSFPTLRRGSTTTDPAAESPRL
ncbi:MAG TPA: hypothetical protein VHM48_08690, partial [Candidatus Limnocylindrales bacterium]|nr:hypothetical protein [Candidatus Limnocylindrales bacterium]